MKKKNLDSFPFKINGRQYFVKVKHFIGTKTRTKCWLYDHDLQRVFIGVAKLNKDDGDIYNEKLGEQLAFSRSLAKRDAAIEHLVKVAIPRLFAKQMLIDKAALLAKFNRMQEKVKDTAPEKVN